MLAPVTAAALPLCQPPHSSGGRRSFHPLYTYSIKNKKKRVPCKPRLRFFFVFLGWSLTVFLVGFLQLRATTTGSIPIAPLSSTKTARARATATATVPSLLSSEVDLRWLSENAPNCEFDDLARSYPNPRAADNPRDNNKNDNNNDNNEESCWHLEWEYLQVPTTAILNRHQLADYRLGNGKAGAVFRALIHLPQDDHSNNERNNNNNDDDSAVAACYAALKTDLCRDTWVSALGRHFLSFIWDISDEESNNDSVPCVMDNASSLFQNTFLKGEITGMLLHYSFHRRNLELPSGLLPTWAVVQQQQQPSTTSSWQSNWWPSPPPKTRGYPAEDPSVVGVLLPLRQFAGVWDLDAAAAAARDDGGDDNDDNEVLPHTPAAVAQRLLPAARGLEIVHGMGLLHQDIHSSNVALYRRQDPVVDDTGRSTGQQQQQKQHQPQSLLYDYGLMSASLIECTAPHMCDFCHSPHIGQRRWGHKQIEGRSAVESDVYQFAQVLTDLLLTGEDHDDRRTALLECRTATELVRLLEDWAAMTAQGD